MAEAPLGAATRAVLFDLDGTLADTAPDLGAALNRLRGERGLAPLPLEQLRQYSSAGARGLVCAGFETSTDSTEYEALRERFLELYGERVCVGTRLFPGMAELLSWLGARHLTWGIVTNKATRFTRALVAALGLEPACVVCGDTTPHLKPHPAPLLKAAELLGLPPAACCYVGDDLRDIQAAHAAGMRAVAVRYGYTRADAGAIEAWRADAIVDAPLDLIGPS